MKQCFIISLPRSGSTLLQRLLSQHPKIATRSEPWAVLPFVYALRPKGVRAEYNHRLMVAGFQHLLSDLPQKEGDYFQAVGEMLSRLQQRIAGPEAEYFLDKTPRYHLILDELKQIFPAAKFIVLHRNPLAVVASIVNTWREGRFSFKGNAIDIYEGPQKIVAFAEQSGADLLEVSYEQLVSDTRPQLDRITEFLGLNALASISLPEGDYFKKQRLGDPTGVHRFKSVSAAPLEQWRTAYASPIRRKWARNYLEFLGRNTLQRMGYQVEELLNDATQLPISWKQTALDLVDVNLKLFPLLLAPSLSFKRNLGRNQYQPHYRWVRARKRAT